MFSRMPPAVFPAIMGLLGLGLALRRGLAGLGLPEAAGEAVLGAVVLLWAFAALAYGMKILRRPGVVVEDMRVLPGRAGLVAGSLCLMLVAAALVPYGADVARGLLYAGLGLHAAVMVLFLRVQFAAAPEARGVTPIWHLQFVGFIIGALAAVPLGLDWLAQALLWGTVPLALAIWAISAVQLFRRIPPAPLRPLLAIHLSPAALFATVAASLGAQQTALIFAAIGGAILIGLIGAARWITEAGFSAMWGAFTFPLAAYVSALFALDLVATGTLMLIAALGVIPPIAFRVHQAWGKGDLAARTNAAQA